MLLAPEILEPAQHAPAHAGVAEVQVVLQGGHAARVQRRDEEVRVVEPDLVSVRNVGVQVNFKVVPLLQLPYVWNWKRTFARKAPTRAFTWLKAPIKIRHYAKWALTHSK